MEYKTKTSLALPFHGVWMVSNGGRTIETNNHMRFAGSDGPQNQLYAYDFRFPNSGNEKKLNEFTAFGKEVLSPGDGRVIQVLDGSIDVLPGEPDRSNGVGNTIIIDHQNGEFSLLCHFMYQSICVRVGEKVTQGQTIGRCGNTGNTSQPHIHFNLQDGPRMHLAKGLPAQFTKIKVDGKVVTSVELIRNQMVTNL